MAGHWRTMAVSVAGAQHVSAGRGCQDAFACQVAGQFVYAAVADGAGSAPLAEVGAQMAAQAAIAHLCACATEGVADAEEVWRDVLRASLEVALQALRDEAARRQCALKDFATTLLLAAVSPNLAVAAQIGDGAVVCGRGGSGNELVAVCKPVLGEYLNETVFLTSSRGLETAQLAYAPGPWHNLAVFSDGLQMVTLEMPAGLPSSGFFLPMFRFAEQAATVAEAEDQLATFLRSPAVVQRTDDDLTLLLATWASNGS